MAKTMNSETQSRIDEIAALQFKVGCLEQRIAALTAEKAQAEGERDRQYEFNIRQIAKQAELEAERDRLHTELIEVTNHRAQLVTENTRLEKPVSNALKWIDLVLGWNDRNQLDRDAVRTALCNAKDALINPPRPEAK